MVRKMYGQYTCPSAKMVYGLPTSWDPVVATIFNKNFISKAAWSPCSRLIAVAKYGAVDICDAATLNPLSTFKFPPDTKIQAFCFSPDGQFLAQFNGGTFVTWDLQTGASVSITFPEGLDVRHPNFSSTYSVDGKMIAVIYEDRPGNTFIGTHNLSTAHTHLYNISERYITPPIWTHGEFLRFATLEPGNITIWEVDFNLTNRPKAVKSFIIPIEITGGVSFRWALFLPMLCRLGIVLETQLLIWEPQGSKCLLDVRIHTPKEMSFSSNGHFFAYLLGNEEEVHVWREAPAGYILHQKLIFSTSGLFTSPLLSPNGELIIIPLPPTIHLWHTKDPILSSSPTSATGLYEHILRFCPNKALVALAQSQQETVTILDPQSGDLQLAIDTSMRIEDLGINGNTIVVISKEKIVTVNLASEGVRATISSSIQLNPFPLSDGQHFHTLLLSPDLSCVSALWYSNIRSQAGLGIYDVSNGNYLAVARSKLGMLKSLSTSHEFKVTNICEIKTAGCTGLFFTPDSHEIYCISNQQSSTVERWKFVSGGESEPPWLQDLGIIECPQGVMPWQSSCGYTVTDDGWILSSIQKRLLWLPPRWRSYDQSRIWSGEFLGLKHQQLSEPVIFQFLE